MANDISISVKIANQSSAGFASINTSLRTLKSSAGDAAQGLRTLTTRGGTASLALKNVSRDAGAASRSLDDLRTHAGDVRIKVKVEDDTRPGADAVKAKVDDLKRLGPVQIDVTFNGAAGGITATNTALNDLKSNARDAGQATQTLGARADAAALKLEALKVAANGAGDKLATLRDRAATAAVSMEALRVATAGSATAMNRMNTRSELAGNRLDTLSGRSRTLHQDLSTLNNTVQTTSNSMNGLRGNLGNVSSSSGHTSGAVNDLKGALISLAPALVPIAAALVPIVTGTAAAGVGLAAFGAAVIPQVKQLSALSSALDTLAAAQDSGAASSQAAVEAQQKALASLDGVPQATKTAAAAFGLLDTSFHAWSNSLAGFTMDPVTKSFAVAEGILPKLSPLVKDTSTQLSRLMTVAGGGIQTRGFDDLMTKFDHYTNSVLKDAVNETVHFSRVLSEGDADGPVSKFMDYAKSEGPQVKKTLEDLSTAVGHVLEAASDAGPGLLTVVDALAKLINAVPPELLGRMMQLYTTLKLIKLGGAGLTAVAGGAQALATRLTALGAASTAAGGGLAGVRAAIGTLSTGAKITGTVAVVAGLVIALKSLSGSGQAAPNVDRLTTSLGNLGRTGKVTGEAATDFGKNLDGLSKAIDRVSGGGSKMDHFNDSMNKVFTLGMGKSNSLKAAEKDLDSVDKALANLVQGGNADLAAAAVAKLSASYAKTGKPTKDLTDKLDDYKSALADAKFEADLTAQSQGLFGKQAEATQKQLDAQKQSADGLRQSIQALNDVNRAGLDAQIDFQQSIADATKAYKDNGRALTERDGQLVLGTDKARNEATALTDLAAKTDAATAAARDQGKSWTDVNAIYAQGRDQLIKTAEQMGLNTKQAKALADQILKTPDKTARLTGNIEDLQKKISTAKASLKTVPASKTASIKASITQLQNAVRDAKANIASVQGKSVVIRATYSVVGGKGMEVFHEGGNYAHGGVIGAAASGGVRSGLTMVGERGPELVDLAAGSRVRTANDTARLMSGASGGSAGGWSGRPIELSLNLGGRNIAKVLIDPLREEIRELGGDVQYVLGRR